MRSIGSGQWRHVSEVNQKQEGHTESKGLAALFIYLVSYYDLFFFTSILIRLWRNNEQDAAAAAPYVCALFRIDLVSFRPHMTCKYQIDPQEMG